MAAIHGVSLPTVDAWVAAGCPFEQRGGKGREWRFDTAAVIRWRLDQAAADPKRVELEESKRRRAAAVARLTEHELETVLHQVAPVEDMLALVAGEYAAVRASLMNMPGRLALKVAVETDPAVCAAILRDEVDDALKALALDCAGGGGEDGDDDPA